LSKSKLIAAQANDGKVKAKLVTVKLKGFQPDRYRQGLYRHPIARDRRIYRSPTRLQRWRDGWSKDILWLDRIIWSFDGSFLTRRLGKAGRITISDATCEGTSRYAGCADIWLAARV